MDSILRKSGYFKSFDGEDIYYESRGSGAPLFFCYGIGCLFNHWSPQVQYFAKNREVIMMDYRGHHKTAIPHDKESLTIENLAKDVIAYCDQFGIDSADFVGHSFGCQVLLQVWRLRPELFKTMVFVNGVYRNPFAHMAKAEDLVNVINHGKRVYNKAPGLISTLWEKGVTNPLLVPLSSLSGGFNLSKTALKDIEIYARGVSSIDFRVFITFFEQMVEFNAEEWLSKITVPTLIICGSKDALTPMESQEKLHELLPNSEIYPVPYGSHCTQLDFPEMVNLKIENFMAEAEQQEKRKPGTVEEA